MTHLPLGRTNLLAKSNISGMEGLQSTCGGRGSIWGDANSIYYSLPLFFFFYKFLIRVILSSQTYYKVTKGGAHEFLRSCTKLNIHLFFLFISIHSITKTLIDTQISRSTLTFASVRWEDLQRSDFLNICRQRSDFSILWETAPCSGVDGHGGRSFILRSAFTNMSVVCFNRLHFDLGGTHLRMHCFFLYK